jgi:N-acetylglucosaminyl-diphospho-decaprenol L-rhamnosyltransferase
VTSVGVVMVTFRGGEAVAQSLDALATARERLGGEAALHAVVVDNASRDGTVQRVEQHAAWAEVVELPKNIGFAGGCNVGIARCRDSDVIVLLNPDVAVAAEFLRAVAALDWPADVAARGPAIRSANGSLEQSARGFPRARTGLLGRTSLLARIRPQSRLLRDDLRADADGGARAVDWVSGACLIAPAERFSSIGPLDEGYFMYWEDADWCHRAHARGYTVLYDPTLAVTHDQGSSSRYRSAAATVYFHRSALRYWRTNVARTPVSTVFVAAALGARCALKLATLAARRVASRREASRQAR